MRIERDSNGESYTGSFMSEVRDAEGQVVFTARGTVAGTRIRPEPLP